nr:MAG TPA: hypothetical protein [Caudoviricetes sp.]
MEAKISPDEARDMLEYYANLNKTRKNFVMDNLGIILETAYGTHRTITVSKKSPLYLHRNITKYKDPTILLEGVNEDPLLQNSYYTLLKAVLNSELPDFFRHGILEKPCNTISDYIENVRLIEDWYNQNRNTSNGEIEVLILSIYMYMIEVLSTGYAIDTYMNDSNNNGSVDMFKYILNSVKKAILNPESVDVDKLSDNIDSFYETITGCSPTSNSVLVVLVEKYGINYNSNHIDDRFNNFMKDKNLIKNIPSTRVKSSDLYDIVDRLDRSNIPRLIQQMTSFDKWSKEDKLINANTVIDVMPDRSSYFNTAITGLVGDDLPFVTSATDSRVIPIRSGTSTKYYHFIMRNNKPLLLYKLLPVDGGLSRYFAISLDPENELIGEITKDNNVTTEFVCENPNIALGKFFME